MNVFKVVKGQIVTNDILTVLGLGCFLANEFDIQDDQVRMETEFSLTNFDPDVYEQLVYSSPHQQVIESFDKPIVEAGDLVVCAVTDSQLSAIKKNYNEYGQILGFFQDASDGTDPDSDPDKVHFLFGMSNASQTDFFEPFQGVERVVFNTKQIETIVETYGLDRSSDWNEVAGIVEAIIENKMAQS